MPNHEDWKLLLRRSFGIPDLIDDGVAIRSLREQASEGIPIPAMTRDPSEDAQQWPMIVDAVIYKVRDCGERGQLDEYLLGMDGATLEKTADEISAAIPPRVAEESDVAKRVLVAIRTFVRSHPFRAEGGYFGQLDPAEAE
ncbi:MAG: hypothetical protein ACLPUG_00015 [Acidimicrobiales bacterium]